MSGVAYCYVLRGCKMYDNIKINNIELKDIDKEMPLYTFIGKTIEKLIWQSSEVYFKFTDGTYGNINIEYPANTKEEKNKYRKDLDSGSLSLSGFCFDESLI